MVSVKYIMIVLRADDEGEGGTFAVYSLLSRYVCAPLICSHDIGTSCIVSRCLGNNADMAMALQAHIVRRDPREERSIKMERVKTNELNPGSKSARNLMERSAVMKALLKIVGVLGVSLVMSGMLQTRQLAGWS